MKRSDIVQKAACLIMPSKTNQKFSKIMIDRQLGAVSQCRVEQVNQLRKLIVRIKGSSSSRVMSFPPLIST
jgi:hypothetical protein